MSRLVAGLDLRRLGPSVVLIQAGHNDVGMPLPVVGARVRSLLSSVHQQVPAARVGLVTVFTPGGEPSAPARDTDASIVAAARAMDRRVVVVDPEAAGSRIPRVKDGLHPSEAGQRLLARSVAQALVADGAAAGPLAAPCGPVAGLPAQTGLHW